MSRPQSTPNPSSSAEAPLPPVAATSQSPAAALQLVPADCCLCGTDDAEPIGVGEDFEYRTSDDYFRAVRCRGCGLVYLDPRPAEQELPRIYPSSYHAFDFSSERFGLAFRVRRRLEARRLLALCRTLPADARILDVGCGDGFHLDLLREFGPSTWQLEGVDPDERAATAASRRGLRVHHGVLDALDLPRDSYDLVLLLQTLEHLADPRAMIREIRSLLRPGGRLIVVTDNTGSIDFRIFSGRHWGGYHFPRHWSLFSPETLRRLAGQAGMEVLHLETLTSPVNWVYSLRNLLADLDAPTWLVERFSLRSPVTLALFTLLDRILAGAGRGALLRATLGRSAAESSPDVPPPATAPFRSRKEPVAILGGGFAGLTAGDFLARRGIPFRLFEASSRLAGLASSFTDEDGFHYDFGAHFITNRLAAALGVGSRCRVVRRYGETVFLRGKTYSYPFGLLASPRYTLAAASAALRKPFADTEYESAEELFRAQYGNSLATEVVLPILERWSGVPASELSPAVADKIPKSLVETMFLTLARRVTGRAVAIGYCGALPQSANVFHVYPDCGMQGLCESLAARFADRIALESPVERILVEDGRVRSVRVHGQDHEASAVVSTLPVNVLAGVVEGTSALEPLRRFRYRPMIFVNLRLRGRGLLADVMQWTPEPEFPFFRLTEVPVAVPWLAPAGKTLITADIGCEVGDELWGMSDEQLGEVCIERLKAVLPDANERYLGCRVLRTKLSYPIYLRAYECDRRKLDGGCEIGGLSSVGRNGEFMHVLLEDVFCLTRARLGELEGLPGRSSSRQR